MLIEGSHRHRLTEEADHEIDQMPPQVEHHPSFEFRELQTIGRRDDLVRVTVNE